MNNKANRGQMCQTALQEIEQFLVKFPNDPALQSTANQLSFLIEIENDRELDRSRLTEINFGRYAVYELSNLISDDLSKLLCLIDERVRVELRNIALSQKGFRSSGP